MIDDLTDDPLAIEVQASSSFNNYFVSVTNLIKALSPRFASPRVVKRTNSFIRACDLNISGENIQSEIDDERTDRETSERDGMPLVPIDGNGDIIINALVEIGLAEAGDETSRWIATSGTTYVLKNRLNHHTMGPWENAASGKDVLVWSTKCVRELGAEYPVVKARGLINASAEEVVDLLRDSRKVSTYNKSSLGRKDKIILKRNFDSEAKIMSSLTKPPIVRKPLECVTLFYSRKLTENDNIELSPRFRLMKMKSKKGPIVYLNLDELKEIIKLTPEQLGRKLDNARDWLIISCFTGQRISDFMRFKPEDIREIDGVKVMDITQQKGNKQVTIPLFDPVQKIIKKYGGGFPRTISDQRFNEYAKEVAKIAGLTDKIEGGKVILGSTGKKRKESGLFPKWELIASHVGRRSFATNFYGKIQTPLIMNVTGHTKESTFLGYIGKSSKDTAVETARAYQNLNIDR